MSTHINQMAAPSRATQLDRAAWIRIGLLAAAASIAAVLAVQVVALAVWPATALFKPLDSYARSALFTLVPALGATGVFAGLVAHRDRPVADFVRAAAIVLILSIIPDYVLPVEHKTFLASTITASLHVVAALTTVGTIIAGYWRERAQP